MTPADLLTFVRRSKLAVVSTTSAAGAPQAAVVGIAVTDALEIVFDTLETSRKAVNLRRDARIALVIGWDEEQTVQCEGIADEPAGAELERIKAVYIATFPDGLARQSWPGLTLLPGASRLGPLQRLPHPRRADRRVRRRLDGSGSE